MIGKFFEYGHRGELRGYVLAVLAVILAFGGRLAIDPWLKNQMPYTTFIVAVAVTGLAAGARPALFAIIVGGSTAYFCFVPPRYHFGLAGIQDEIGFQVYLVGALAIFFLALARDRAGVKLAAKNAEVKESESRFHTLADNIAQLAWMADNGGRRFWFNQRWFDYTGTTLEEMQARGWQRLHHPDHVQRVAEGMQHSWDSGEPWEDTFPLRGKDGSYRWFFSSALPIRDAAGRIVRWFGTNTDVSDRMGTEAALRRSEKLAAVGKLAASVAHELNNPLTTAVNLVFLAQHDTNDATRRDYLARAELELQRVSSLANRTLSFYHGGTSKTVFSIEALVTEAVGVFRPVCAQRNILLKPEIRDVHDVNGSKDELWQVLINLLSNAIDAIGQDGVIRIRTKTVGRAAGGDLSVRLTVADTGCGIDARDRKKIFEPFFTTKGAVSSGLGLWITNGVVLNHGGSIRYRSCTVPKRSGTVMSITLPAVHASLEKPQLLSADS